MDIDLQCPNGCTVLMRMSRRAVHPEAFDNFLKLEPNVNLADIDGNTALHFASLYKGTMYMTRALLQRGADPHLKNNAGNTAMQLALEHHLNLAIYPAFLEHEFTRQVAEQRGYFEQLLVEKLNQQKMELYAELYAPGSLGAKLSGEHFATLQS